MRSGVLIAAAGLLLCGCGAEKVETYRAPKEKDPELPAADAAPAAQGSAMADTAVPTANGAGLAWQAPADWQPRPASAMRKATFIIPGAAGESELSVTAFPGDVGGELANVNRWRGQAGLPALQPGGLDASVDRVEANGLRFTVVELEAPGSATKSILGAIVPVSGSTWFFKLTGPAAALRAAKPAFIGFLRTVREP
ncbi:MAG TPA: hypothetical protein VGG37_06980 [Opitutaceae bacterium]|jgi:hypothetical protein